MRRAAPSPVVAWTLGAALCGLLLLIVPAEAQGRNKQDVRTVADCQRLRQALVSEATTRIDINGSIVCDPDTFGPAVVVTRKLTLAGVKDGPVAAAINWQSGIGLVLGGQGAHVVFQDLIFRQRDMGLVNMDITFYDHLEAGTTTFLGVVIATEICPLTISNYRDLVVQFTRPDDQPGEQVATMLDESALLLENLYVRRQKALWRLCRTVLYCGDDTAAQEALLKDFATSGLCDEVVGEETDGDDDR